MHAITKRSPRQQRTILKLATRTIWNKGKTTQNKRKKKYLLYKAKKPITLLQQTAKVFMKKRNKHLGDVVLRKGKEKKSKGEKSQSQQPLLGPRRPRPSKFVARRLRWGYKGRTAVTVHCRTLPTLRSSLVPSSSKMRANLLRCLEKVRRIRAINVVKVSKCTYFLDTFFIIFVHL